MYIEHSLTIEDVNFLTSQLNQTSKGFEPLFPFGFFIKDAAKQIQAGVNGSMLYGAIYVDQLWVDPTYRHQGLGSRLMEEVHALGRKKGCTMATVCTMDFLGVQKFYEQLGYQVDFVRLGYEKGSSCIFLSKKLGS